MKRVFVKKEVDTKITLDKLDQFVYGNNCFNIVQENAGVKSTLRISTVEAENFVQTLYDNGYTELLNE